MNERQAADMTTACAKALIGVRRAMRAKRWGDANAELERLVSRVWEVQSYAAARQLAQDERAWRGRDNA